MQAGLYPECIEHIAVWSLWQHCLEFDTSPRLEKHKWCTKLFFVFCRKGNSNLIGHCTHFRCNLILAVSCNLCIQHLCTYFDMRHHVWTGKTFYLYLILLWLPLSLLASTCYFTCYFYPFVSLHLSVHPCLHHCLCGSFCLGHMSRVQRFEGFRNEKTMPPSLEPSCSGTTEEGPVTTNHLRLVPNTHSAIVACCYTYFYSRVCPHLASWIYFFLTVLSIHTKPPVFAPKNYTHWKQCPVDESENTGLAF